MCWGKQTARHENDYKCAKYKTHESAFPPVWSRRTLKPHIPPIRSRRGNLKSSAWQGFNPAEQRAGVGEKSRFQLLFLLFHSADSKVNTGLLTEMIYFCCPNAVSNTSVIFLFSFECDSHNTSMNITIWINTLRHLKPTYLKTTLFEKTSSSLWQRTRKMGRVPWRRSWCPWTSPGTRWSTPPADSRWCKGWKSRHLRLNLWYSELCGTRNTMWESSLCIPLLVWKEKHASITTQLTHFNVCSWPASFEP